jgi:hypothetical protein
MKGGEARKFLKIHTARSEERRKERKGEDNVETNLQEGTKE